MKNILKTAFVLTATIIVLQLCGCSEMSVQTIESSDAAALNGNAGEMSAVAMTVESGLSTSDVYVPMKYAQEQYVIGYEEAPIIEKEGGFYADENVMKSAITAANQQLELVPENLWSHFCKSGWTISLVSGQLSYADGSYADGTVIGLCNSGRKTITLSAVSSAYVQRSLLHEFGHFVYYQLDRESLSQLMKIYEENLRNNDVADYSAHCLQNENEYFAESFKRYLRGQSIEENISEFIENVIISVN